MYALAPPETLMSDRRSYRDYFLANALGLSPAQVARIPEWLREFGFEFLTGGPEEAR